VVLAESVVGEDHVPHGDAAVRANKRVRREAYRVGARPVSGERAERLAALGPGARGRIDRSHDVAPHGFAAASTARRRARDADRGDARHREPRVHVA